MNSSNSLYYVYIVTNYTRTVLYTGMTNNLLQRITEHYLDRLEGKSFAGKYKAFYLLHHEFYDYVDKAIKREKEIKGWRREKKINLVKTFNAELEFLNNKIFEEWPPQDAYHRRSLEM